MGEPSRHPRASESAITPRQSTIVGMVEGTVAFPAGLYGFIPGRKWLGVAMNLTIEVRTAYKRKPSLRVPDLRQFSALIC